MIRRTARVSGLYRDRRPLRWARAVTAVVDESLAALCMRQWGRVPVVSVAVARRMPRDGG
jgi:hypothetical protein